MILYKYRGFQNLAHTADILVHQRLYCSRYDRLNDPFEGQFLLQSTVTVSVNTPTPQSTSFKRLRPPREADVVEMGLRDVLVCSLSSDPCEMKLWSHYGDCHQGVAIGIELDFPNPQIRQVLYGSTLECFDKLSCDASPLERGRNILARKTTHWEYEREYRIFSREPYFDVSGRIKEVIVGSRFDQQYIPVLKKLAPAEVCFRRARLDHKSASVVIEDCDWE